MEPRLTGLGLPVELVTPGAGSFPHHPISNAQQIKSIFYSILPGIKVTKMLKYMQYLTMRIMVRTQIGPMHPGTGFASTPPTNYVVTTIGKSHPATQKEGKLTERKRRQPVRLNTDGRGVGWSQILKTGKSMVFFTYPCSSSKCPEMFFLTFCC